MVDKAKQDKGGCFAETCCVISTLFSRSSSSSFFPFFFMSSFTSVSSLSTELRPISNNIHLCYLWWCRYLFNYSAACWFCLTNSAFSTFIWISWIIKIASLVACWSAFLLRSSKHVSSFSLVLVASCSFWAMFDYGCTVLPCQIEAKCWNAVVYSVVGILGAFCWILAEGDYPWWQNRIYSVIGYF